MPKQHAIVKEDGSIYAVGSKEHLERALWTIPGGKIIEGDFENNWDGKVVHKGEAHTKPVPAKVSKEDLEEFKIQITTKIEQLSATIQYLQKEISGIQEQVNTIQNKLTFKF